jgi:hypothetical protein
MRLTCPRCGLSLTPRSATIAPHYCPRCLARRREAIEFVVAVDGAEAVDGAAEDGATQSLPEAARVSE